MVESMNANAGDGSSEVVEPLKLVDVEVIDCKPTTRLREMSAAKGKEMLLGSNRERS